MLGSAYHRVNTLLLVLLVLMAGAIIAILATKAGAGSLDPPGPPASTMKSLNDVPGSWDRRLDATNGAPQGSLIPPPGCDSDRFKCVLTYQNCSIVCFSEYPAVLDEETGLVWERTPSAATSVWSSAVDACHARKVGQRLGWRLATVEEAQTLLDDNLNLPAGSPFVGIGSDVFWTSSEYATGVADSYAFQQGTVHTGYLQTAFSFRAWCVRGGAGESAY